MNGSDSNNRSTKNVNQSRTILSFPMQSFTFMSLFLSFLIFSVPPTFEAFSQPPPPSTFLTRGSQSNSNSMKKSLNENNICNIIQNHQCHEVATKTTESTKLQMVSSVEKDTTDTTSSSTLSESGLRYKNRPIVLIGCSGSNNEIPRLASALVDAVSLTSMSDEHDNKNSGSNQGGVVDVIHSDSDGDFVLAPEDIRNLILGGNSNPDKSSDKSTYHNVAPEKVLTDQDVIVMDYAHPHIQADDGRLKDTLVSAYNDILKILYEELNCLCIYINIHPDSGSMEEIPQQIRKDLENDFFIKFTDYELALKDEGSPEKMDEFENAKWELNRIVSRSYLPRPVPGEDGTYTLNSGATNSCNDATLMIGGQNTFFLSLSFPVITHLQPYIAKLCVDNDAMEFRADLLACRTDRHAILHSQFQLRSMCRPYATRAPVLPFVGAKVLEDALPMVYTVRTAGQAGTWPDETKEDIEDMFGLLRLGIRGAAEIMDVESAWDKNLTDELLKEVEEKYSCLILGSHHVVPDEVSPEKAVQLFQQCGLKGRAHGAKVVLSIEDSEKASMAYDASLKSQQIAAESGDPVIPGISLVLGEIGVQSRILNNVITPVTHPALPFKAAPGQLSSEEIMEERVKTGMVPSKQYAILGHNIAYSVSPQMQGSAFKAAGLPHIYGREDVETVEEFIEGQLWNADNFGGVSVTIPHKQNIMPYVDVMSDAATKIGAVNTITAEYDDGKTDGGKKRIIYGDNTDWRGIYNPLKRRLSSLVGATTNGYALILGGGGTARAAAYAAQQMGLKRIFYNRTTQKAQELADSFGGSIITSLSDSCEEEGSLGSFFLSEEKYAPTLQVVISTLPASVGLELPSWIFSQKSQIKPIIFDVNYKPYWTKLLHQAQDNGCDFVRGSEMLWEQGVGQFEIWTQRTAPYKVMKDVVLANCLPGEEK